MIVEEFQKRHLGFLLDRARIDLQRPIAGSLALQPYLNLVRTLDDSPSDRRRSNASAAPDRNPDCSVAYAIAPSARISIRIWHNESSRLSIVGLSSIPFSFIPVVLSRSNLVRRRVAYTCYGPFDPLGLPIRGRLRILALPRQNGALPPRARGARPPLQAAEQRPRLTRIGTDPKESDRARDLHWPSDCVPPHGWIQDAPSDPVRPMKLRN